MLGLPSSLSLCLIFSVATTASLKTDHALRFFSRSLISRTPSSSSTNGFIDEGEESVDELWRAFKAEHSRMYASHDEELESKDIFHENLKTISAHNILHQRGLKTYKLGVNQFADIHPDEFAAKLRSRGCYKQSNHTLSLHRPATFMTSLSPVHMPAAVDWRDRGFVTPVKNQQACGSCWSFSATGALEGQHMRKTGKLVSLSEQNLVDCSVAWGNNGCNGGLMDYAFQYVKDNGGIDTEESYPYNAKEGFCHFKRDDIGATDVGYSDIPAGDEAALKEALATVGPVSVAIDASHPSFQLYSEGVYAEEDCSSEQLDHGVLAVGYGTDGQGQDYWIVKNSWSEKWGEGGYIKMARNQGNMCGIASAASYPLV